RAARGRIVLIGSISGRVTTPLVGPYSASKHALVAVAAALRLELRPWGIAVALIEPGAVATPIWDKGADQARRLVATLPPRAQQLYGGAMARMTPLIEGQARSGVPPRRVAEAIAHALTARRPRTDYRVGREAAVAARLRWLLPDPLFDRLMLLR